MRESIFLSKDKIEKKIKIIVFSITLPLSKLVHLDTVFEISERPKQFSANYIPIKYENKITLKLLPASSCLFVLSFKLNHVIAHERKFRIKSEFNEQQFYEPLLNISPGISIQTLAMFCISK